MPADRAFLDTNVLVYSLMTGDAKNERAKAVRDAGGVISVQVLNELANVIRRKLGQPWETTREMMALVRSLLEVVPLTEAIHDPGLRLTERYSLSIYDAMIAAAALDSGCDILWSEDMHDGLRIDGRLTVRNPFR